MRAIGVIPARFASTRFPAKILAPVAGKPLLQWVVEGCRQSRRLQDVLVATDDARIADLCRVLKVEAVMTSPDLTSGTDRVWAAARGRDADLLVNVQGDEPLIEGHLIDRLVETFDRDPTPVMATLAHPISDEELASINAVKVVIDANSDALYFSRFAIPYSRHDAKTPGLEDACLKHIGLYAYTKDFLRRFCEAPPSSAEKAESLEQLRALHLGAKLRVVKVPHGLRGVDSPADLEAVEPILRRMYGETKN